MSSGEEAGERGHGATPEGREQGGREQGGAGSPAGALAGARVLITRTADEAAEFIEVIRAAGGSTVAIGTIESEATGQWEVLDRSLEQAPPDMVIFTSARAVSWTAQRVPGGLGSGIWAGARILCAGSKTAQACREHGLAVWRETARGGADAVEAALADAELGGLRVLLPRSEAADRRLPRRLAERGAWVEEAPIYRPAPPPRAAVQAELDELRRRLPAWLAFTSPSAFDNLMWLLEVREPERYLAGSRLCAIGSTTAEHLKRVVGRADVVSEERSLAGLAGAIVEDAAERTREREQ